MIRVLHVVSSMNRGGLETFIMNVYRSINRSKIQFDFLVFNDKECDYDQEIKELGGKMFYVAPRKQGVFRHRKGLDEFFNTHPNYKIIHVHISSLSNVTSLKIAKKHKIKCRIVHSHNTRQGGSRIHNYIHKFNQLSLESYATDFFACSDLAANWMYPNRIFRKHQYKVINNGIDSEKFAFNNTFRSQKRDELNVKNKLVIGHIGAFHSQKNHDFLIDIFKEIQNENKDSVLLLVGDGKLKSQMEKKVNDLGITENVIFTGVRSDILELLQAMDLFVLPSLYEGLPVVLVEAQAAGLKCFTSDKVVTREANIANLVEFRSLNQSAKFWAQEILKSKDYIRDNTTNSMKHEGYDIVQIAEELQNWYESKAN